MTKLATASQASPGTEVVATLRAATGADTSLIGEPSNTDGLTAWALAYLALPNVIFLFGWFRLPVALLLCAAMVYFLAGAFWSRPVVWRSERTRSTLLIIVATSCAWSAFGGGSHFMYANTDWEIRDAVLGDLVNLEWPVHYLAADGGPLILRSAIGFFLPPALFGKLFGLAHIDLAMYVWTVGGVLIFLLLLPLPRRAGWRLALALLLVVFFSGMDFVGIVIATESMPIFPLRLEWWAPLSYPSLTGQLLWAPNHCLPSWIAALLCFRHRHGAEFLRVILAFIPLTLIWTPFTAIGLFPFVILAALHFIQKCGWHHVPWDAVIAVAIFSLPIGLFLMIDLGQIEAGIATTPPTAAGNYAFQTVSLHTYLLFAGCEFLFLAMVIAPHVRQGRQEFWLAVVVLLALPLLRFGPTNDLGLRLSTIPLVILLVICLQTLFSQEPSSRPTIWIACMFLVIGAHTAFNELWRSASLPRSTADYRQTLADRQGGRPAAHYVGRLRSSPLEHWIKPLPDLHPNAT